MKCIKGVGKIVIPQELGAGGERIAEQFLRLLGFTFIGRDKRYGPCQVDLLFRDGQTLVLVEVKTATGSPLASKSQHLKYTQRNCLRRAARQSLREHPWAMEVRLDLLFLQVSRTGLVLKYEPDCFY